MLKDVLLPPSGCSQTYREKAWLLTHSQHVSDALYRTLHIKILSSCSVCSLGPLTLQNLSEDIRLDDCM